MRQWREPERARFVPKLALPDLKRQELAVSRVYRYVVVRVAEVDARSPQPRGERLSDDVRRVHLELLHIQ